MTHRDACVCAELVIRQMNSSKQFINNNQWQLYSNGLLCYTCLTMKLDVWSASLFSWSLPHKLLCTCSWIPNTYDLYSCQNPFTVYNPGVEREQNSEVLNALQGARCNDRLIATLLLERPQSQDVWTKLILACDWNLLVCTLFTLLLLSPTLVLDSNSNDGVYIKHQSIYAILL